jgi:hypothetical protein
MTVIGTDLDWHERARSMHAFDNCTEIKTTWIDLTP